MQPSYLTASPRDEDLLRRRDVLAIIKAAAEMAADGALRGESANAARRESAEAMATKLRWAVYHMPDFTREAE